MADTMTIKQIAEAAGRSTDTVLRAVKKFFPEKIRDRTSTYLTREQVQVVMLAIRVKPERLAEAARRCRTDAADVTAVTVPALCRGLA